MRSAHQGKGLQQNRGARDWISAGAKGCSLTIVVANYNHGRFLSRCLQAIVEQTRLPDEVLVIDDCSQDNSLSIVGEFAPSLPGFRLICHSTNQGVVGVLNEGLREAKSSHVLFAAADDWIEPRLAELAMHMVEQYPTAGVCSALTRLAAESGEIIGAFPTPLPLDRPGYIAPSRARLLLTADDGWFNGNTAVVNRAAAVEMGGYRAELGAYCDGFLNVALALKYGACFIPKILAVWRRMGSGYATSHLTNPTLMFETFEAVLRAMNESREPLFDDEYIARWTARWRFTMLRAVLDANRPDACQWIQRLSPRKRHGWAALIARLIVCRFAGRPIAAAVLFGLIRSRDLGPVLRRRIRWALLTHKYERPA